MRPAWGGLEVNPLLQLSCLLGLWQFLGMAEAHAGISRALRGICHQLRRQVSGPGRQWQVHPSREGGSSPLFWARRGCQHRSCQSMLETRQTLTNSARFPLTSLQPYLVAQPKSEAQAPFSAWPVRPALATGAVLGLGVLMGKSPKGPQGIQNLQVPCCGYFSVNECEIRK